MDHKDRIEICKKCKNKGFDLQQGIIVGFFLRPTFVRPERKTLNIFSLIAGFVITLSLVVVFIGKSRTVENLYAKNQDFN